MDELIKIKEEDETQLLEKFRDLLNEKKVKIRQQQRLLASANVDPQKLANVSGGQSMQKRTVQASRAAKRKVKEEPESSDDGFQKMDVDEADDSDSVQEEGGEDQGESTADETASGTGSDDEPAPQPKRKLPVRSRRNQAAASTSASNAAFEEDSPPPPKRKLPFMKKPAAPAPKPVDDDETESDEEL